jgi:hypothetical protein
LKQVHDVIEFQSIGDSIPGRPTSSETAHGTDALVWMNDEPVPELFGQQS